MNNSFVWVIPCFNELTRLPARALDELLAPGDVRLVLVDDGSTDGTAALLEHLAQADAITALLLPKNVGKAEAVRAGLRAALQAGATAVGYLDADFATPASEAERLRHALLGGPHDVVLGARVRRLGATIDRQPARHYLGRAFATAASFALGVPIYDTQCGAKLFRATPILAESLQERFTSRWVFDVELLQRLLQRGLPPQAIHEVPLEQWRDVAGSKLTRRAFGHAGLDLVQLALRSRR